MDQTEKVLKDQQVAMLNIVEDLQKLKANYRELLENSRDGILVIDQNNNVIWTNNIVVEMYGISLEAAKGKPITQFIVPTFQKQADEDSKEVFAGKKISREYLTISSTGKKYWVEAVGRKTEFEGQIVNFILLRDITDRKESEIVLKSEKEKLERYFELTAVIVLIIDLEGKILLMNKQGSKILGCPPGEFIGKNWITDFVLKSKNANPEKFIGILNTNKNGIAYFEHPIVCKDKKEIIITWGKSVINDEKGQAQAFLFAGEDITALRKAEARIIQLKEFNILKDEFLNIAAHELKTPLTSIIGLSEIIKEQKTSLPQKLIKFPDIIFNEGLRLSRIVKRILTITRFESGKEKVQTELILIDPYLISLLPNLEIMTKNKKMQIALDVKDKNLQLRGDKERLSEVIMNLFDNAVKYGSETQTITISAYCSKENTVTIEVADQGKGIPPELVGRLFGKFSQLEPSFSRSQEGIGLGLYICKLIVEKMGGEIGVESVVDKGSRFFFTLPSNCHVTH